MRNNQQKYKPQNYVFRKSRKGNEALLSQLCDQFMIRRNHAKTFEGFKSRLLAKLTSWTIIQNINPLNGRNINKIKISIS